MVNNIKLLGLNIKDYFGDLILLIIVGFLSNLLLQLLFFKFIHVFALEQKLDLFPLSYELIGIFIWITAFLIIRWVWYDWIKTLIASRFPETYRFNINKKKLTTDRFLKEWIFQGNSQPNNGGLLVTNSNSGCLIKPTTILGIFHTKRIWKNFIANIEIEFLTQSTKKINPIPPHTHDKEIICVNDGCNYPFQDYLGIVFRAQSFDDYFMLEVTRIEDNLVIRPHIRIGGNWDAPILNIDSNSLPITKQQLLLNIIVKDEILTISLGNSSIEWIFPTNIDTNLIQQAKDKEQIAKTLISEIYFRNRAGMFGFRCYGNQIALIKSLDIVPNA